MSKLIANFCHFGTITTQTQKRNEFPLQIFSSKKLSIENLMKKMKPAVVTEEKSLNVVMNQ